MPYQFKLTLYREIKVRWTQKSENMSENICSHTIIVYSTTGVLEVGAFAG